MRADPARTVVVTEWALTGQHPGDSLDDPAWMQCLQQCQKALLLRLPSLARTTGGGSSLLDHNGTAGKL